MPPKAFYKQGSNTPLSRGKWDAMEGGIRVPSVIEWPSVIKSRISTYPSSTMDIFPTIVDIFPLSNPVPKTTKIKPRKKVCSRGIASVK